MESARVCVGAGAGVGSSNLHGISPPETLGATELLGISLSSLSSPETWDNNSNKTCLVRARSAPPPHSGKGTPRGGVRVIDRFGGIFMGEEMATHSSILAWKIPWMEPGRLQSMGSQRVGHDFTSSLYGGGELFTDAPPRPPPRLSDCALLSVLDSKPSLERPAVRGAAWRRCDRPISQRRAAGGGPSLPGAQPG